MDDRDSWTDPVLQTTEIRAGGRRIVIAFCKFTGTTVQYSAFEISFRALPPVTSVYAQHGAWRPCRFGFDPGDQVPSKK